MLKHRQKHRYHENPVSILDLEIVIVALIDDAPGHASVDPQGEVLHDTEELDCVISSIIENLVAEHGAHWVVPHIIRHSDMAPEK